MRFISVVIKYSLCLCAFVAITTLSLNFSGCSKEDSSLHPQLPTEAKGVYILNEGNFNRGNSTLTFYIPDSNKVYDNIFESVNQKKLGDTGNSIAIHDGKAYIVVNGSNKIEIVATKTHKSIGTIILPAGSSPRHITIASNTKAFVSNLYDNSVSVVDLTTNTVTGKIPVGNNPEEMLIAGDNLYVTNSGFGKGNTITVIDLATNSIVKTLIVGDNPLHIRLWKTTTAIVLCGGDFGDFNNPNDDTPGKIFYIDLPNQSVKDSMSIGGHPFEMAIDKNENLYALGSAGVIKINLISKTTAPNSFISGSYYTIAFDEMRNQLYVTDPKDYLQPGTVKMYDLNGVLLRSFSAGINPGWIAFME